ncbi:MAG: tetratricopeptide repeat protein [Candidatus Zhuqueibacterota bacterium]
MKNKYDIIDSFMQRLMTINSQWKLLKDISPERKRDIREIIFSIQHICNDIENRSSNPAEPLKQKPIADILESFLQDQGDHRENIYKIPIMISMGDTYFIAGEINRAQAVYIRTLSIADELKLALYQFQIKFKLGKTHAALASWELAELYFRETYEYYQEREDIPNLIEVRAEMADLYFKKGEYNLSQKLYAQTLRLAEEIKNPNKSAYLKNRLGVVSRIKDERGISIDYLEKAVETFKSLNEIQGLIESLNELAMSHLQKSNYEKSLNYLNECVDLCNTYGDYQLLAYVNLNKAIFYLHVGDYRHAAQFCSEGLKRLIQIKNPIGLAKVAVIYGHIFRNYRQYNIALEWYEESIRFYQDFDIPLGLANSCQEYAEMLSEMGEMDQAIKHMVMAKDVLVSLELTMKSIELEKEIEQMEYSRMCHREMEPHLMGQEMK